MNKRRLHHVWTKFRAIKPWYFLAATLVFGTIWVFALRANYQHMVQLRNTVYAADKSGQGVDTALNNLRQYIYSHMNTNPASGADSVYPPIQLKYTYDRLVAAENAKVASVNSAVYTDGQHYCEQQDSVDFSGRNRTQCVADYANSHGVKAQTIPDGLYKFGFISPRWSPDLAGWSLLATIVTGFLTITTFLADRWFKHRLG